MSFWDYAAMAANPFWAGQAFGLGKASGHGASLKGAWKFLTDRPTAPQMGQNPYQSQWNDLITQLGAQARGEGPSLAGEAFKQGSQTGMNQALAMGRGGSAGATRAAQMQLGRANQGMAQGYSNARLQEQFAARQALTGALGGAGQAWFQPNYANLQTQLQSPTNLQMLTQFGAQAFGGLGQLSNRGGGQGGGGKPLSDGLYDPWG